MPPLRSVTVYAASAPEAPVALRAVARALGAGIAARGWLLVYGGATIGATLHLTCYFSLI